MCSARRTRQGWGIGIASISIHFLMALSLARQAAPRFNALQGLQQCLKSPKIEALVVASHYVRVKRGKLFVIRAAQQPSHDNACRTAEPRKRPLRRGVRRFVVQFGVDCWRGVERFDGISISEQPPVLLDPRGRRTWPGCSGQLRPKRQAKTTASCPDSSRCRKFFRQCRRPRA